MSLNTRQFTAIRRAIFVAVVAYWVYFLATTFHHWPERLWVGGFIFTALAIGFQFERWRWRGEHYARVSFFVGAVPCAAGLYLPAAFSNHYFTQAACVEIGGGLASLATWAVLRSRARQADGPGRP
jgi:hypothetical protein